MLSRPLQCDLPEHIVVHDYEFVNCSLLSEPIRDASFSHSLLEAEMTITFASRGRENFLLQTAATLRMYRSRISNILHKPEKLPKALEVIQNLMLHE